MTGSVCPSPTASSNPSKPLASTYSPSSTQKLRSVPSPDTEKRPGEGIPRRHPLVANRPLLKKYDCHISTIYESFLASVRKRGKATFLGTLDISSLSYKWLTYEDVAKMTINLS